MKYLLFFFFTMISVSFYAQIFSLAITIPNLKNTEGIIEIGVYNKKENFPKEEKQYKHFKLKADNFSGTYTIKDLPKGEYAIAVYHDKNADGICNSNLLGIPQEGYGFSKNIKPFLSAPSFNDCKITLNTNFAITIKLIY